MNVHYDQDSTPAKTPQSQLDCLPSRMARSFVYSFRGATVTEPWPFVPRGAVGNGYGWVARYPAANVGNDTLLLWPQTGHFLGLH